ncbi:MAG: hypothetical protein ACLFWH_05675 [Actinomycetota bacterium]
MSEAARNDLYNGLSELLGPERAETLMSYLPRYDPDGVATRSDVDSLRSEMVDMRSELKSDIASLRSETKINGELIFSLQRTLIAGFITFGAALVGLFVVVL